MDCGSEALWGGGGGGGGESGDFEVGDESGNDGVMVVVKVVMVR